jgi:hypothetical protein
MVNRKVTRPLAIQNKIQEDGEKIFGKNLTILQLKGKIQEQIPSKSNDQHLSARTAIFKS